MEVHHYHKPKLWQGWPEFAKELGTIVLAVLIALGAGQVAEWLRQRHEMTEARDALRAEIAYNAGLARLTMAQERCLGAMETRAIDLGNGAALPPPRNSPRQQAFIFDRPVSNTWDTVKAGAVALMPLKERVAYSRFYDDVFADRDRIATELDWLSEIGGITARDAKALTPDDMRRLTEASERARRTGIVRADQSRKLLNAAKAMGISPSSPTAEQRANLAAICDIMGMAPEL